jgi:hypothetical protein
MRAKNVEYVDGVPSDRYPASVQRIREQGVCIPVANDSVDANVERPTQERQDDEPFSVELDAQERVQEVRIGSAERCGQGHQTFVPDDACEQLAVAGPCGDRGQCPKFEVGERRAPCPVLVQLGPEESVRNDHTIDLGEGLTLNVVRVL